MNNPLIYKLENIPCEILYFIEDDEIYIDVIKTEVEYLGMGYARKTMESFLLSLNIDKTVTLLCSGCLGGNVDRLVKWYEGLNFVEYNRNGFGVDMILEGIK